MLILIFIAVTGMRIVADVLECFDNPVLPFQGWTSTPSPIIRQKPDPIAAMANHVQLRGGLIGIDVAVQKFQVKYESDIYQIFKLDHPAADPSAVLPSCGWKGAPWRNTSPRSPS